MNIIEFERQKPSTDDPRKQECVGGPQRMPR